MNVFMQRALELAQLAKGYTAPNPMVGAVLVHESRIIAEGWHHYHGGDHAEVDCLNRVAESDRPFISQSTLYVNLEPCAHYGLTPPCALRLAEEQVEKVVIANTDPFEKVKGRGIEILQNAGVEVQTGVLEQEGLWVNRRFFCFHNNRRPYIILKWAQGNDGFFAPPDKSRMQISGNASMQLVHKWRTEEAAIMVGTTTARNDNPELTSRLWKGKQPLRIVLNRRLDIPPHHHVFNNEARTWMVNELEESEREGVHYVKLASDKFLLNKLLDRLYEANILSLIVEGGEVLLNSFIRMGLWDEARVFTGNVSLGDGIEAPVVRGGVKVWGTTIENDGLQVFVNKNSAYPYVKGMEL